MSLLRNYAVRSDQRIRSSYSRKTAMSAPSAAFVRERKENVEEASGERDVPARMRESCIYTSQEAKVVRLGRKAWPALYKSISPIV